MREPKQVKVSTRNICVWILCLPADSGLICSKSQTFQVCGNFLFIKWTNKHATHFAPALRAAFATLWAQIGQRCPKGRRDRTLLACCANNNRRDSRERERAVAGSKQGPLMWGVQPHSSARGFGPDATTAPLHNGSPFWKLPSTPHSHSRIHDDRSIATDHNQTHLRLETAGASYPFSLVTSQRALASHFDV